jgi:hypothetical protein
MGSVIIETSHSNCTALWNNDDGYNSKTTTVNE